ncbi:M14 family metallopeptidase [Sediminicurvatus halobius]|uniref:Peptidase M14 n=1 Tax=Sediminicurvatus halobius TaxID=2182432 RepID=A0A2U2N8C4_9GAMM|nr:M14 family metallopeptidase [Spiribacter halobius]PWG65244.1 peptidase M14 [Spiribacter halobius]UEX78800.1 M14 family metallopeptidase [Spiribacter halobius]
MTPQLRELDHLPEALLTAAPQRLAGLLGGPTLIHLSGRRQPPLFVSVLAHGNEHTGFAAVQRLLRRYAGQARELPRALSLFIGNVDAAAAGVRRLDGQVDYNRVWPGTLTPSAPEAGIMATVTERLQARGCFASVDIHNNTGINPHYACVNRLAPDFLALASLFSRTVVYFTRPQGVQSLAFARFCPAVTLECGQSGSAGAVDHAEDFLRSALALEHVPAHVVPGDLGVYHTVAVARVARDCRFGLEPEGEDLSLLEDIDRLNFRELPAGTELGRVHGHRRPVIVTDNDGADVTPHYLECRDGSLRTRRRVFPAMLTRDVRVIYQDCLCYFMERIRLEEQATG